MLAVEEALNQCAKALVAGQPKPRNSPASKIAKANFAALRNDAVEPRPTGISRCDDAADTRSREAGEGDVVLFKDAQNPKVRVAAREAAAQRECNAGPQRWLFGK